MKDEEFVKMMKEVYPMSYESLVDDFERHKRLVLKREKELEKLKNKK